MRVLNLSMLYTFLLNMMDVKSEVLSAIDIAIQSMGFRPFSAEQASCKELQQLLSPHLRGSFPGTSQLGLINFCSLPCHAYSDLGLCSRM